MINSLKYAKQLEEAGVSREQAETHIRILTEVMENSLATKQDLKELDQRLSSQLIQLDQKFSSQLVQLEQRMTIKIGTIVTAAIAVATALAKLIA